MKRVFLFGFLLSLGVISAFGVRHVSAAAPGNFSLQVTPSPLVATVKPAESKTLELKVKNNSTGKENLKITSRAFTIDQKNQSVNLDTGKKAEIDSWLRVSEPTFSIGPGEVKTLTVRIDVPPSAGFSYSFAFVIERNNPEPIRGAQQQLQGSVAIFTLINIDRPGSVRKLELTDIHTKSLYEYLPAEIELSFKNTGNTIIQPYGNVFIQRDSNSKALATLPVNETDGYILPNIERTLTTTWDDGFPVYKTTTDDSGNQKRSITWNIDKVSHFRIGKYTAKIVAVYNDGQRDVPVMKEVTFWVIPWKAILSLVLLITGLILLSRFLAKRRTDKAVKKALAARKQS